MKVSLYGTSTCFPPLKKHPKAAVIIKFIRPRGPHEGNKTDQFPSEAPSSPPRRELGTVITRGPVWTQFHVLLVAGTPRWTGSRENPDLPMCAVRWQKLYHGVKTERGILILHLFMFKSGSKQDLQVTEIWLRSQEMKDCVKEEMFPLLHTE